MFNIASSRAARLSAFGLLLLAACGGRQTTSKTAENTGSEATGASTTSTSTSTSTPDGKSAGAANPTSTPEKKQEVATGTPTKSGSGSNDAAEGEGFRLSLIEVDRPPFAYTLKTAVKVSAGPAPTLTKVSEKKNKVTDEGEWFEKNQLRLAGRMPSKTPGMLPTAPERGSDSWGDDKLHYVLDHGDHYVLMYGANFAATTALAVFDKGQPPRAIYEFSSFVKPPEVVAGEERLTGMEVFWAQKVDDILYVSSGHHTFAASSKGKNAFITAVGVNDGQLRWQSDPLVCNSTNFVVHGAYIICGYGFSKEDDFLYVISRADGKTVSKTKIANGATFLVMKGNQLFVRAYDTDYVFDVK